MPYESPHPRSARSLLPHESPHQRSVRPQPTPEKRTVTIVVPDESPHLRRVRPLLSHESPHLRSVRSPLPHEKPTQQQQHQQQQHCCDASCPSRAHPCSTQKSSIGRRPRSTVPDTDSDHQEHSSDACQRRDPDCKHAKTCTRPDTVRKSTLA